MAGTAVTENFHGVSGYLETMPFYSFSQEFLQVAFWKLYDITASQTDQVMVVGVVDLIPYPSILEIDSGYQVKTDKQVEVAVHRARRDIGLFIFKGGTNIICGLVPFALLECLQYKAALGSDPVPAGGKFLQHFLHNNPPN